MPGKLGKIGRVGTAEARLLFGAPEEEAVAAAGPAAGDGLLLERDTDGTEFLLLETGDFLLLEG